MKDEDALSTLNRLLSARLAEWRLREKNQGSRPKPVITITQEPGCGAEKIAERLSSELDLHLYDWELVEQVAKAEQVSPQIISTLEKDPPNGFAECLAAFAPEYSVTRYVGSLKRILLAIAVNGNAIIMGRGSNFFLPPDKKIGLCFIAPVEMRIKNIMEESGSTEKEARKHISMLESAHRKSVKKYLQADLRDPVHYHLVVNTALVKPDIIVQLVKTMIQTVQVDTSARERSS